MGPIEKQLREVAKVHASCNSTNQEDWFEWAAACQIAKLEAERDQLVTDLSDSEDHNKIIDASNLKMRAIVNSLPSVLKVVMEECGECKGKGSIEVVLTSSPDEYKGHSQCPTCKGEGKVAVKCNYCAGNLYDPENPRSGSARCPKCIDHGYQTERVRKWLGDSVWVKALDGYMEAMVMGIEVGNGTMQLILWAGEEKFKEDIADCYADEISAGLIGGKDD